MVSMDCNVGPSGSRRVQLIPGIVTDKRRNDSCLCRSFEESVAGRIRLQLGRHSRIRFAEGVSDVVI